MALLYMTSPLLKTLGARPFERLRSDLIYLGRKCFSPLHYNDICPPGIPCPAVPSRKLDYCL